MKTDERFLQTENGGSKAVNRRKFLKSAGAVVASGVAISLIGCDNAPRVKSAEGRPRRYGMIIDLRRCVKCESCTVACKAENNIPVDSTGKPSRRILWNHLVYNEETGSHPTIHAMPQPCNHCEHPACVKVCPVGATYHDESRGICMQNTDTCIGCRYCTVACPYTRRYFNWEEPNFPHIKRTSGSSMSKSSGNLNPMLPERKKGVTEKCVFCYHRIISAEERAKRAGRPLADGEVKPACVTTCLAEARIFGDLNDPKSEISLLYEQYKGRLVQLEKHLGTEPKVFYIPEEERSI